MDFSSCRLTQACVGVPYTSPPSPEPSASLTVLTWDHLHICTALHHLTVQCIKYVAEICFHSILIIGMFATKYNIILKPDQQAKATETFKRNSWAIQENPKQAAGQPWQAQFKSKADCFRCLQDQGNAKLQTEHFMELLTFVLSHFQAAY